MEPQLVDPIVARNPFFRVRFTNETTINGRRASGPGPHVTGPRYVYHASIRRLNQPQRDLHYGDKIRIENWVHGQDDRYELRGHLDFRCTVRRG